MGQRLNIEIWENGKCLANAYYHWSGYTENALELTKRIVDYYPHRKNIFGLSAAIELLRKTGAGVMKTELINAGTPIELAEALSIGVNRDNGLIAFSEKEMAVTRNWEEGRVTIDIGTEIIDFNCWCYYKDDEVELEKIYTPFDTHKINFNDLNSFIAFIGNVVDKEYHFCNNEIYTAIY